MARKAWGDLSAKYRAYLEKQGLTAKSHAAGAPLRDTQRRQQRRALERQIQQRNEKQRVVNAWIREHGELYGLPTESPEPLPGRPYISQREWDSAIAQLRSKPLDEQYYIVTFQERMQQLYSEGYVQKAREMWDSRDPSLPDWMYFYHGVFS